MSARSWLQDVREHADPHLTCILVGNKVDLCSDEEPVGPTGETTSSAPLVDAPSQPRKRKREVSTEEAEIWAQEEGLLFVETSAKSGHNVEVAFERATRDILEKVRKGEFDEDRVRAELFPHCDFWLLTSSFPTVPRREAIAAEKRWVSTGGVCPDVTVLLICFVMLMFEGHAQR